MTQSKHPWMPKPVPLTRGQLFLANVALGRRGMASEVTYADLSKILLGAATARMHKIGRQKVSALRGARPHLVIVDEAASFPRSEV